MKEQDDALSSLQAENARLAARVAELEAAGDGLDLVVAALEAAPYGAVVASTAPDGPIHYVNTAFTVLTGYSRAHIPTVREWLLQAYPDPDYRAHILANWDRDVREPDRDVIYRVRCADGRDRHLHLKASLLAEGHMVVTVAGPTQLHQALQELEESEARFQGLADNLPLGLAVHSLGRIVYLNRAAVRMAGVDRAADLIGTDVFAFVHPDSLEITRQRIATLYAKEGDAEWIESTFQSRDGRAFPVEVAASRVDWRGKPAGLVLFNDIAARKQAETERHALEQRIQDAQRMESLALLAGGVAHDFNNLLVGVLGNADLALLKLPRESAAAGYVRGIEAAARQAADLARQMLAYSGRGQFVVDLLDLRVLLRDTAHLMEAVISKKILIRYDFDPGTQPVLGDATQLRQVVMNLFTNASDAIGDQPGTITASLSSRACDTAWLDATVGESVLPPGTYTILEIADTGCGMTPEVQRRIFDPFFTTRFTGRGLGLAAVLGIAKGHRGAVSVWSAPGQGTRFRLLLPASEATLPAPLPFEPRHGEAVKGTPARVLVVDDEETVRTVCADILVALGYEAEAVEDGFTAVDLLTTDPNAFDVVVLDLSMPRMDGRETFRELRRIRPDLRVVLSSGYNEAEATHRFPGEAPSAFIQKPYRVSEIRQVLARVLED